MLWATQEKCNSAILSIFTCTNRGSKSTKKTQMRSLRSRLKKTLDLERWWCCPFASLPTNGVNKHDCLSFYPYSVFRNMRASVTNAMCTKTIHANTIADKQRFMLCFIKSIRCNVNKWTRGPFRQPPIQALFTHSDDSWSSWLQSIVK